MSDNPEYDVIEFLLAGLFVAGASASLVWAGSSLYLHELPSFAEGSGLSLMFFSGIAHPKKYVLDCLTFPFTVMERTGRETPLSVFAGALGFALWLGGLLASHFA
jgi:hypothetical protein